MHVAERVDRGDAVIVAPSQTRASPRPSPPLHPPCRPAQLADRAAGAHADVAARRPSPATPAPGRGPGGRSRPQSPSPRTRSYTTAADTIGTGPPGSRSRCRARRGRPDAGAALSPNALPPVSSTASTPAASPRPQQLPLARTGAAAANLRGGDGALREQHDRAPRPRIQVGVVTDPDSPRQLDLHAGMLPYAASRRPCASGRWRRRRSASSSSARMRCGVSFSALDICATLCGTSPSTP